MKNRRSLLIVFTALLIIALAIYSYPQAMLSPGELIPDHQELASDCFACHFPFQGATSSNCTNCHETESIGLKTTKGQLLPKQSNKIPFHQHLQESDCLACHSDHEGVMAFRAATTFDHALLDPVQQNQCQNCHMKPTDSMHQKAEDNCLQCHTTQGWTPASFDHALLDSVQQNQCQSCHMKPTDSMHQKVEDNCLQCHTTQGWTPASFDHEQWFRFDKHHKPECTNCHINKDFSTYTCTSCHEHSPAKIRREHLEEGIFQFDNCVECHRSGNEHETVYRKRSGDGRKAKKRRNKRDEYEDDDYGERHEYNEHDDDDDD